MTMTIDEALNQAEAMSAGLNWILLSQYEVRAGYASPEVSIDLDNRVIGDLSENVSTEGENNAEYISFIMDRYHDGVDLSNMLIQIQYELEDGSGSIDGVVNAYMNDDQIKFGWVVPPAAAQVDAIIKIMVFCTGTLGANTYTLKTLPMEYTIHSTLETGGSIPQPDENWYLQFANTMQQNVLAAKESADAAAQSASDANDDLADIKVIQSDVNSSKSTVQTLTAQVQSNTTKAQASADAAKVSEQNAAKSEANAKMYAENASAVTGVQIAKQDVAGLVKGGDIFIAEDGTIELTRITTDRELKNSHPGGLKINSITGAPTEQESTTGKNLAKKYTVIENATPYQISLYIETVLQPDTDYVISLVGANGNSVYLNEHLFTQVNITFNGTRQTVKAHTESDISRDNKSQYVENCGWIIFKNSTGNTVIPAFKDIQLELGPTATEYEPYTGGKPSPSPDYPQEIKSVVVSEVKSSTLQLLNYDAWKEAPIKNGTAVFENNGVTITATVSDAYTAFSAGTDVKFPKDAYIPVSEGEIITMSWEEDTNANGKIYIFGNGLAENGVMVNNANAKQLNYAVPSGITFITFRFGVQTAGEIISYKNIMIDRNGGAPWQPYQESVIALSEPIELHGIGEVTDRIVQKDGVWGVERENVEITLDGTETINGFGNSTSFGISTYDAIVLPNNSNYEILGAYSERFIEDTPENVWMCKRDNTFAITPERVAIRLYSSLFTTQSSVKEYFASNPTKFIVKRAEPTFEPLPTADQIALHSLKSFDGVTHISTDSELEPIIEVEHGTSRVGALALECYNDKEVMKLEVAAMKAAQTTTEEVTE